MLLQVLLEFLHQAVQRIEPLRLLRLRRELPPYVQYVLAGQSPPVSVTDHVGGIVVIRC